MKTVKADWYYCDLYGENIYFYIGCPSKKFKKACIKRYNYRPDGTPNGRCLRLNNGSQVIWIKKANDMPSLVHEICHAASNILESRGIDIRDSNCEAYCYLVENILSKALEITKQGREW